MVSRSLKFLEKSTKTHCEQRNEKEKERMRKIKEKRQARRRSMGMGGYEATEGREE
jgi:hypothetical protein